MFNRRAHRDPSRSAPAHARQVLPHDTHIHAGANGHGDADQHSNGRNGHNGHTPHNGHNDHNDHNGRTSRTGGNGHNGHSHPDPPVAVPLADARADRLAEALRRRRLEDELTGRLHGRSGERALAGVPVDGLIAAGDEPHLPDEIFPRLRWGGLFAYIGTARAVRQLALAYIQRGFAIEKKPAAIWHAPLGLYIPPLATRGHYFIARKTQLIQPGDLSERFTYHVELVPDRDSPHGQVVCKRVPDREDIVWRLCNKYPDIERERLERRAHKLVDHVFPTFLTREAAFLKLLQRDMPEQYRSRVPRLLDMQKDSRGFVRELRMTWLRNRSRPIDQLEFAKQSAELLAALHDHAGIMHLDLRLDNMVLTDDGVGFVDFGSAVRVNEQLHQSNMLNTLFSEMMQTSQIQRMLGRMLEDGRVTNQIIADVHGKVDKTVDVFYLAVQINQAQQHPELRHLVRYDPASPAAEALERLTAAVLRPKNPEKAPYKSANDLLRGIARIERKLREGVSGEA